MLAHFLGNLPIDLKQQNFGGLGSSVWDVLLLVWLVAYFIGTLALLAVAHFGLSELRRIVAGKARCPDCGEIYSRPIFGLNAGLKRYERCPACGAWHWIDARDNV